MKREKDDGPVETPAEMSTWWTPEGFIKQKTPAVFLAACNSEQDEWNTRLGNAGYTQFLGSDPSYVQIKT
jgi:hypothetical protein